MLFRSGAGLAFSPDSKLLAKIEETGRGPQFGPLQIGFQAKLLDAVTGLETATLADQCGIIAFASQGTDATLLLTVPALKEIKAMAPLPAGGGAVIGVGGAGGIGLPAPGLVPAKPGAAPPRAGAGVVPPAGAGVAPPGGAGGFAFPGAVGGFAGGADWKIKVWEIRSSK